MEKLENVSLGTILGLVVPVSVNEPPKLQRRPRYAWEAKMMLGVQRLMRCAYELPSAKQKEAA
eukprot:1151337-Pelagomonas_calceolata.AAC.1